MQSSYEIIVNSVQETLSIINAEHRYEAVSDSWCTLVGRTRSSVIGRTLAEVWGEVRYASFIEPQLRRLFAGDQTINEQALVDYPAAGVRECLITYYPHRNPAGQVTHAVVVTRDISELEKTRRSLQSERERAELASRAKSEFLASMSHELRTPLNAILGFSQLLYHDAALSREQRKHVDEIEKAGKHLLTLVSDLLDLSRFESGQVLDFSVEPVNIQSVVKDCTRMMMPLAGEQGLRLINHVGDDGNTTAYCDYSRLRQVIINLLSNAIKYNQPGGSVRLSSECDDKMIRILVTDTGKGIPAEQQDRLFTAFDRLDQEGVTEGSGIGLVITRRIIEAMGGKIGFSSLEGQGTTFWVDIPAGPPFEFPLPTAAFLSESRWEQEPPSHPEQPPRLLLAEDNPINQRLAIALLKRMGYAVDVVDNGEKALAAALSGAYRMVLMDCQMPVMDGYEATAAIRLAEAGRSQRIPIVAMTANVRDEDIQRCLACGMNDFIAKPVDLNYLRSTLERWL